MGVLLSVGLALSMGLFVRGERLLSLHRDVAKWLCIIALPALGLAGAGFIFSLGFPMADPQPALFAGLFMGASGALAALRDGAIARTLLTGLIVGGVVAVVASRDVDAREAIGIAVFSPVVFMGLVRSWRHVLQPHLARNLRYGTAGLGGALLAVVAGGPFLFWVEC